MLLPGQAGRGRGWHYVNGASLDWEENAQRFNSDLDCNASHWGNTANKASGNNLVIKEGPYPGDVNQHLCPGEDVQGTEQNVLYHRLNFPWGSTVLIRALSWYLLSLLCYQHRNESLQRDWQRETAPAFQGPGWGPSCRDSVACISSSTQAARFKWQGWPGRGLSLEERLYSLALKSLV